MNRGHLYRLVVGLTTNDGEDVDPEHVERSISARVPGFRTRVARGFWKGEREDALVVTIVDADEHGPDYYTDLAQWLAIVHRQDAVLLEKPSVVNYAFVGPDA